MFFLKKLCLRIIYGRNYKLYFPNKEKRGISPSIGYAHPSHIQPFVKKHYQRPSQTNDTIPNKHSYTKQRNIKSHTNRKKTSTDPIIFFEDNDRLEYKILKFITPRKKTTEYDIKKELFSVIQVEKIRKQAESREDIHHIIETCIKQLKQKEKIYYDTHHKSWYISKYKLKDISKKEASYLKDVHGLGNGWRNINSTDEVIQWIVANFSPDEFESFCCALLEHANIIDPHVSEKRKSGADGGIDGHGWYKINGQKVKIIFQAKRYIPTNQVTENEIRDFLGAYDLSDVDYGFFITTSIFSENAKEKCKILNNNKRTRKKIELIDKNRIVKIMLSGGKNPKGFGLYKTPDLERLQINEKILKSAVMNNKAEKP